MMPSAKKPFLPRSKLTVPETITGGKFITDSARISQIGELMVQIELLRNDIKIWRGEPDVGTDIITQHFEILKRVQIKSQETDGPFEDRFTFSTRRGGPSECSSYADNELDVFIFVHTEKRRFFIVPASKISPERHKITFGPNSHSQWGDAWWVLKQI